MVIKKVNLDIVIGVTSAIPETDLSEIAFAGKSASNIESDYKISAYVVNMPVALKSAFDELNLEYENVTSIDDMKKNIEDKDKDIIVIFSDNFDSEVAEYDKLTSTKQAPQIEIYYNSSKKESSMAYASITTFLNQYESSMINKFDVNADTQVKYDLASDKDSTAQIFSQLFPMLLLMTAFTAGLISSSILTNHCFLIIGSTVVLQRSCVPTLWL